MLLKFSRLSLATFFILQSWSVPILAQDAQCDARALASLLQKNQVAELEKFTARCGATVNDDRGFTLYDRARLAGSDVITQALSKQMQYSEGSYSTSMGKLIQTGLRFLNFDAGVIDGHLGNRSVEAIKRYQKRYGFAVDGKLHSDWLADFYRRLIKETQKELSDLGFDAGGADGVIGPKTLTAMQAFRQESQIPVTDYREIDDQLLYQLMMLSHEKNKKALAKRDAERAARRAAQEAARRREVARARQEAQQRAEMARQAAEAAEITARQQREAQERRLKLLDIAVEKNKVRERQEAKEQIEVVQTNNATIQNEKLVRQQELAKQQAQIKAEQARIEQERVIAEQAAAAEKAKEVAARQAVLAAKAAEEQAEREAQASAQAADKARKESLQALKAVKRNQPLALSKEMVEATAVDGSLPLENGFRSLQGIMRFNGPSNCTVNGHPIESNWCEAYYPSGNGKNCEVSMTPSGMTIGVLCGN